MKTQLSANRPRILLLGSGELGRELTISLKRLGAHVTACDSYDHAPAMQVADAREVFDMTDEDALRSVIERTSPDLIVPEVEKVAVDVLRDVSQSAPEEQMTSSPSVPDVVCGHTPRIVPNSAAVAATFDRRAIRELAAQKADVPTSRYRFAYSCEELKEIGKEIGYPCFVKPTMSSSGHGQSLVQEPSDMDRAWQWACEDARAATNCVIVESMVDFDFEITLLTVRSLGEDDQARIDFCAPIGHRQLHGDYVESWQPQPMTETALARAKDIAKRVVDALVNESPGEETYGLFGVELFVCADDEVYFSEVSPRPHDTGMVTSITQHQSEFDLHARALLGLPVNTDLHTPGASAVIKSTINTDCPQYVGVEQALALADDVRIFNKPAAHDGRRMGVVLARGRSSADALVTVQAAAEQISVIE